MSNSVYHINKNINKSIEFKGLKAQYIWYLGGGLVCSLILFAILYICGVSILLCIPIVTALITLLFLQTYRLSRTYGEYGMMKKIANRSVPKMIKHYSNERIRKQLKK